VNPVVAFATFNFTRKHFLIVFSTLVVLIALPVMVLISVLGKGTLGLLSTSTSVDSTGLYTGPPIPNDTYAWGNCTYWAFAMRVQAGDPIPTTWGNANTWALRALADGYIVDHTPSVGVVMATTAGDLGHVAYVTAVDPVTGSWTISEMNAPNYDVVDSRTLPAVQAILYSFIHDKVISHEH
jgi:surface antigen